MNFSIFLYTVLSVTNFFSLDLSLKSLESILNNYMFEIDMGRVGIFRVGMEKDDIEIYSKYHFYGKLDTTYINLEGQDILCYKVIVDSEYNYISLIMDADGRFIEKIEVFSDKFKTATGIGVGNTYGEFEQIYGKIDPVWGDRGQPVLLTDTGMASFVLEEGEWWIEKRDIPQNAVIVEVFVW